MSRSCRPIVFEIWRDIAGKFLPAHIRRIHRGGFIVISPTPSTYNSMLIAWWYDVLFGRNTFMLLTDRRTDGHRVITYALCIYNAYPSCGKNTLNLRRSGKNWKTMCSLHRPLKSTFMVMMMLMTIKFKLNQTKFIEQQRAASHWQVAKTMIGTIIILCIIRTGRKR